MSSTALVPRTDCTTGISLVAKDVCYRVKVENDSWKTILENVSLCVQPCELLAIMGSSGAGKSTLLNVLADRAKVSKKFEMSGQILFNGRECKGSLKKFSSYVMQADNLPEYLTVEEAISFAAKLRLKKLDPNERKLRVENVIRELSLEDCRKVPIGGGGVKAISGGQKKRVSIAMEILGNATLLLLDEPTSGLDSSMAYEVIRVLTNLAKNGRTIVCTIHQPRSQVFAMFDKLMLLADGKICYCGAACEAMHYFAQLGYPCPSHFNPADYLLDVLTPKQDGTDNTSEVSVAETESTIEKQQLDLAVGHQPLPLDNDCTAGAISSSETEDDPMKLMLPQHVHNQQLTARASASKAAVKEFPERFCRSSYGVRLKENVDSVQQQGQFDIGSDNYDVGQKRHRLALQISRVTGGVSNWFYCFKVLAHRSALNCLRDPMQTKSQILIHLALGLIIGALYFQLARGGKDTTTLMNNARNFAGVLFFGVTQYAFAQFDTLVSFPQNRTNFNRETANGLYKESVFYIAYSVAKLPSQHVPAFLYATLVYWMVGFSPTAHQYLQYMLIAGLTTFAAAGYCFFIGCSFTSLSLINIIASFGLLIFMLLTGYLLRDSDIPWWINWAKYFSFMRYSYMSFLQTEFPYGGHFGSESNESVLHVIGVPASVSVWMNIAWLFVLGLCLRVLGFVFLTYSNRSFGVE